MKNPSWSFQRMLKEENQRSNELATLTPRK